MRLRVLGRPVAPNPLVCPVPARVARDLVSSLTAYPRPTRDSEDDKERAADVTWPMHLKKQMEVDEEESQCCGCDGCVLRAV